MPKNKKILPVQGRAARMARNQQALAPRRPKAPPRSRALVVRSPAVQSKLANRELAAYAAVMLDPLAPVSARIPDANNANTAAFRVVTTTSTTATNGYVVVAFNPTSLNYHYAVNVATDAFSAATTNCVNYASYTAIYKTVRVVSAAIYVLPNVTEQERVGQSYCGMLERGVGAITTAEFEARGDTGPNVLDEGCYFRWSRTDSYEDNYAAPTNTNVGPQILFKIKNCSTTSQYTIRFVANYEATVAPAYGGIIAVTPSPRYPDERSIIDNRVATLPHDATVKQQMTGGPTPSSAPISGALTSIANGVGVVSDAVLGKGNIVSRASGWIGKAISTVGSWFGL